ncbi:MAG: hypothetical protein ABI761_04220 [Saprospiraceae bacterium]
MPKYLFILLVLGLSTKMKGQHKTRIEDCNCIVSIPGTFKMYVDTIETAIGKMVNHTFVDKDSILNYQLFFVDYPEGTMHSDSILLMEDFFTSTIDESVLKVNGTKKYESEINQFGYPGWFWKINFGRNKFIKTKSFMAGRRFYTMQVIGNLNYDLDKLTFPFFDSFQFIDLKKVKRT